MLPGFRIVLIVLKLDNLAENLEFCFFIFVIYSSENM